MAAYANIQQTSGENRGPWVEGVAAGAIVFTAVAVALRCWSRATAKAGFWWDDYMILISLPFTWALIGLELGWVSDGLGRHVWAPGVQVGKGYKVLFAIEVVYDTTITLIRLSVVLFYWRIFGRQQSFRIALWVTVSLLIGWYISITVLAIFLCSPVQKQWDYTLPGHCYSLYGTFIGVTVPNLFIDLLLLILPVPMLWRLQIKKKKKINLTLNFLLGYSVIVVTVLRLIAIVSVPNDAIQDVTWNSTTPSLLFMIEPAVATVSICLPAISTLLSQAFKRLPTARLSSSWSKLSNSAKRTSKQTDGINTSAYSPTLEVAPSTFSNGPTAGEKVPWFTSTSRPNDVDDYVHSKGSAKEDGRSHTASKPINKPASAVTKTDEPIRRSASKSLEMERRIRKYYERSDFLSSGLRTPPGESERSFHRAIGDLRSPRPDDLESGTQPLRRTPVTATSNSLYAPSEW